MTEADESATSKPVALANLLNQVEKRESQGVIDMYERAALKAGATMAETEAVIRVGRAKPEPWCEPWEAGLASEAKAVGKRLGELLTALDNVDSNIVRGTLPHELWEFRISLHERLKAEGWRITALQNGWKVLPPKRR